MKVVVISDTHGNNKEIIDAIMSMEKPDMLIHLGDYTKDAKEISNILGIPITIVRGNCDFGFEYNNSELIELNGKKLFLTHGHIYDVKFTLDKLYHKALEMGADIALFGHTHMPMNIEYGDILIFNPGSPSMPHGGSRAKTFGIIEIGEKVSAEILTIH